MFFVIEHFMIRDEGPENEKKQKQNEPVRSSVDCVYIMVCDIIKKKKV